MTTLTPELVVNAVTDPDNYPAGGPVSYEFRIATGMDGKSGSVASSGMIAAGADGKARWLVPPGTLKDGGVYAWVVQPSDGVSKNVWPTWSKKIKVDLRSGASGPSPFDFRGPVSVNMANGNANLSFTSPTVNTLGGPMGMSFTYNSQDVANAKRGLNVAFYTGLDALGNAPTTSAGYTFAGKPMLQSRTDPSVNYNWPAEPAPGVPADNFMSRWSGFVQVPTAGNWKFGVRSDGGVKLSVNGGQVLDKWETGAPTTAFQSTPTAMTGTAVPISLEHYDVFGSAYVELWADNVDDAAPAVIVPSDWFSTDLQTLPAGWGASLPIAGGTSPWAKAAITDSAVVLTDVTGTAHTYTKTTATAPGAQSGASGGYTPPAGEYGTVSINGQGRVVLIDEDGTVNQFAADGKLESATPAADAGKPAGPIMIRNSDGLVTHVADPVSKNGSDYDRKIAFTYQNGAQTTCPTVAGGSPAPAGMLCQITYPDSGANPDKTTRLYYDARVSFG